MADIASNRTKIQQEAVNPNSPVSQYLFNQLGGSINYLIDAFGLKAQEYTANGTFQSPNVDVTSAVLIMWGGGAGGGSGIGNANDGSSSNGLGGGAAPLLIVPVTLDPNQVYAVTVGAGGSGVGANFGTAYRIGNAGSNSSFVGGVLNVVAPGGKAGVWLGVSQITVTGPNTVTYYFSSGEDGPGGTGANSGAGGAAASGGGTGGNGQSGKVIVLYNG